MSGYEIVSADAHVLEPTDIWDTWLPKQYREKAPKLVEDADGGDAWLFAGDTDPDPTRLIGMAQMPSLGTDVAIETMRKAKARGFRGVVISMWPSGGESISDDDDPFWSAAADEQMPVCIHINLISRRTRQKQRAAAAKASAGGGAKGEKGIYGGKGAKANAKAVAGLGSVFSTVPSTIGQLIFTGVFERFPELHVSMIETGVGWIPHFLEQIDDRYWRNRSWGNIPI